MEDDMFIDFNKIPSGSSDFEELYGVRKDLSSLLKSICRSCGPMTIFTIISQYLREAISR